MAEKAEELVDAGREGHVSMTQRDRGSDDRTQQQETDARKEAPNNPSAERY